MMLFYSCYGCVVVPNALDVKTYCGWIIEELYVLVQIRSWDVPDVKFAGFHISDVVYRILELDSGSRFREN